MDHSNQITLLLHAKIQQIEMQLTRKACKLVYSKSGGEIPANIRLDEDALKTSRRRLSSSSSEDVFIKTNMFALALRLQKTFSRRLQDVLPRCLQDVFKTSSRHLQDVFKTSSRRLANTSWKHFQDVLKTYHQVKLFLLTSLWEVFNMFVRRCLQRTLFTEGFMVSVRNLQVLVFQFTTPFSGCL